jgi:hypothetical protein
VRAGSHRTPLMKTDSFSPVHAAGQITAKWVPLFLMTGRLPKVYGSSERVLGRHMCPAGRTFSIKERIKQ